MVPDSDIAYLRRREAEETAAAARAHCMARTAHEDMAEDYADQLRAAEAAFAAETASLASLVRQLDTLPETS